MAPRGDFIRWFFGSGSRVPWEITGVGGSNAGNLADELRLLGIACGKAANGDIGAIGYS